MKKFLVLTLICLLPTLCFAVADNGPPEVKFTPKMGTVTFPHAAHQSRTDCATCHHTGDYAQCKSCHGVKAEAPKSKDAYHNLCQGCHKTMQQGPTKCKECHVK